MRGVSKAFGSTQALRGVAMDIPGATIHGLVGGNGSGKSTLIKILAGVHRADAGEINVRESSFDATAMTPVVARQAGLRFVHQHSAVFPSLTVAENLAIGHGFEQRAPGAPIRWRAQRRRAAEVLDRFKIEAGPDQLVSATRPATRSMIAIARALQDQEGRHEGMLVLDEPTRSLPDAEVEILLSALRRYAEAGQTILFVSHRLEEVLSATSSITVLRDAEIVGTYTSSELNHDDLVKLVVGRSLDELHGALRSGEIKKSAQPLLQVRNVSSGLVNDVSFSLHGGEVLGVTGLLGSGRSTLLRMLFGLAGVSQGRISLDGEDLRTKSPRDAMKAGFAYVPEDRGEEAAFEQLSVTDNLAIAVLEAYWSAGRLRARALRADSERLISEYSVKCQGESAPFASLSGGNQQKVILARWMRRDPKVLLLDEPTQGVDVGARSQIYKLIRDAAVEGMGVLVVSSDTEELELLCDRVIVMHRGRISAELEAASTVDIELERLVKADTGERSGKLSGP